MTSHRNIINDHKYLYNMEGMVYNVYQHGARINFVYQNKEEVAVLKVDRFYFHGRKLTQEDNLKRYLKPGMMVHFSCHKLQQDNFGSETRLITVCWLKNDDYCVKYMQGITNNVGTIVEVKKRHGILETETKQLVYFIASKVYLFGKRFPASKYLTVDLHPNEKVFFDAIPCFQSEINHNSKFFATVVFKGQKPEIEVEDSHDIVHPAGLVIQKDIRVEINEVMRQYCNDARKVFTKGCGSFLSCIDDELGVLLGRFKINKFDTIVFNRKNAFVFKISLRNSKLSEVLKEGDPMNFIAVPAPLGFYTQWIAIQVELYDPEKH